jgi:peptide/nickel transport system substrate-binding protein
MEKLQELERLLFQGKITRRDFLTYVSAMGLSVAMSPLLANSTAHAATPKRGGRLRIGSHSGATTESLDITLLTDIMPQLVSQQCRNQLVVIDEKGVATPELAENWESTPDAKQWVFNLRKGVEFHNGKTVDADDVIYSINLSRTEKTKSPAKGILKPVTDIKKDGNNQVIFTLESGNADFPYFLAEVNLMVVPNGTTDFEKGMGTGPFILKSWEPGVRAFTTRNPNYFKEGLPYFDEIETMALPDVVSRTTAVVTGELDVFARPDLKTVQFLKKNKNVQIIDVPGYAHYTMPMLTTQKPFNDNNVRLGLKYAFDRELMLKQVLRGFGSLGNDHPISQKNRFFNSELPQRTYDPDKAKFYLKKAGMLNHTFELYAADTAFAGAIDSALLFQESAEKAGVKLKTKKVPNDGYWEDVWMKKGMCWSFWYGRPTEDWMFSLVYAGSANWNESYWKNARFDNLLKEARSELNEVKRRDMYGEMQKIVHDEGSSIIPIFSNFVYVASSKLRYNTIASNSMYDGRRIHERWWFA